MPLSHADRRKGEPGQLTHMKDKNKKELNHWRRYTVLYRPVTRLLGAITASKFNYSYDTCGADRIDGPLIVIPNHSCAWDPIFTCAAFSSKPMYFVASEHILRWKVIGPVINWLAQPIPRRKAGMGTGTVMACLRQLRAGHSVALFAEGEQTWNGVSGSVFPATGKLVKQSGATLVTFRLEGAYLAKPRWADGARKGKVFGHTVNVYTPEMLKGMKDREVTEAINRDIRHDVWEWQKEQQGGPVKFRCKSGGSAEGLGKAVFMCPSCGAVGTLKTSGDEISCSCGFSARFSETGFFEGMPESFRTLEDWDEWQTAEFSRRLDEIFGSSGGSSRKDLHISDGAAQLTLIRDGHQDELIASGELGISGDETPELTVGEERFAFADIRTMALVLNSILLFQTENGYYQVQTRTANLRKYLLVWEYLQSRKKAGK